MLKLRQGKIPVWDDFLMRVVKGIGVMSSFFYIYIYIYPLSFLSIVGAIKNDSVAGFFK